MSTVNILAVGDVCAEAGLNFLCSVLPGYRKFANIAFCVVNGENANNLGLSRLSAEMLLSHGADVITLGNHAFGVRQISEFLDESNYIIRPANISPAAPGRGFGVYDSSFGPIAVINLVGRISMDPANSPYDCLQKLLMDNNVKDCRIKLVDMHAEATSEKHALAYAFDGKLSALWGTHTHVQTSDARVFPQGTGYITDLGMTGAIESVIGMKPEASINRLFLDPTAKNESAEGPAKLEGAICEIDPETGKCVSVEAVRLK